MRRVSVRPRSDWQKKVESHGLIWHTVNGLKIYPNPDSVAWGLGTLFTNWDWARRMGRYGRTDAETNFTWDRIAEHTERCYAS